MRTKGTLVIPAGQSSGYVVIPIVGDTEAERTESFRVEFDDAQHADLTDDSAIVTILDND